MDLNWTLIAVVAAINFAAALLQASCGFGYAMLAMTLMPPTWNSWVQGKLSIDRSR